MKTVFRSFILFMMMFMTLTLGGGIAFCEPLVMTKGINIKFVFAGLDYLYARGTYYGAYMPNVVYGEVSPGVCRMRNVLGVSPYNPLLNDFGDLGADGFDFARLMIEPLALGATAANPAVNTSSPGYQALVETIGEAAAVPGMKLDIAMFPDAFSENKYTKHYRDGLDISSGEPAVTWPGLYGHQLCWRDDDPATFQVPANHPLRVFWTSLVQALDVDPEVSDSEFAILAFDICDEPLGVISPNSAADGTVTNYTGNANTPWRTRWTNAAMNWRKLQLNAVQGIQTVVPSATILVNSYDAFPESYVSDPRWKVPDPVLYPIRTNKYVSTECGVTNLVYKAHIFEPFRYTHSKQTDPLWTGGYDHNRDFLGIDNDPGDNYPVPVSVDQYHPLLGTIQEAISWLLNWRMSQRNVKMIVTGFGVNEINRATDDMVDPPFEGSPPAPQPWLPTPDKWMWLRDVRFTLETNNMGWCVFEYVGDFATYQGELSPSWASHYHLRTTYPRSIMPEYWDALFE